MVNTLDYSNLSLRIDNATKKEAAEIVRGVGLDLSKCIRLYLRQIVEQKSVPFSVVCQSEKPAVKVKSKKVSYDKNGVKLRYPATPDKNGVILDGDAFYSDQQYFEQIPGFMDMIDRELASTERYTLEEAGWNI